jgi:CYTH domain-containing protein
MDDYELKYTRIEYERTFLVAGDADWRSVIEPYSKYLDDIYFPDTRLRLRRMTDSDTGRHVIKLNKKYESESPYYQHVNRIILTPDEARLFEDVGGYRLRKRRFYHMYHDDLFSIDVFEDELAGLVLCSVETDSLEELMKVEAPGYVVREVTEDEFFEGGNLCRIIHTGLMRKLSTMNTS